MGQESRSLSREKASAELAAGRSSYKYAPNALTAQDSNFASGPGGGSKNTTLVDQLNASTLSKNTVF